MFRCTAIQVSHIGKNRLGNLVQSYYGPTNGLPYDSRQPFISSETVGGQDMLVISPA